MSMSFLGSDVNIRLRRKEKGPDRSGPFHCHKPKVDAPKVLFGCHLFGFAFLAHHLQFTLGRFDLCRNFLLNAGCRFFEFG
jgi:hypothetical protein